MLLPKRDAAPRECEDWIAASADGLSFAVADGATEGIHSRRWARCLTRAWVAPAAQIASQAELLHCARTLGDRRRARWKDRVLPWYVEEKAALGSFAAFLGVRLDVDTRAWTATAIGDCCLVVEEDGVLASSFPASSSAEFTSRPTLLPSHHTRYADVADQIRTASGPLHAGTRLVLLSDAIAAWWFDDAARGGDVIRQIHAALDHEDAAAVTSIVAGERAARRMRNDDVAILRVDPRGLVG